MLQRKELLLECISYFKERSAFQKLFIQMKGKYASFGYFGGKAVLTKLTPEEKQQLGGFFQKDYIGKSKVIISAVEMKKALQQSRFAELEWEQILQAYFGEALTVKKEQKQSEQQMQEQFFSDILSDYEETVAGAWLGNVLENKTKGYQLLMYHYEKTEKLEDVLRQTLAAVQYFPIYRQEEKSKVLLAVFSAMATGNPHFFDEGTLGEKLLTLILQDICGEDVEKRVLRAKEKTELYLKAGIIRGDVSNDTLAYGITAILADGSLHAGIEGFCKLLEPVKLTLLTVSGLKAARAQNGKKVYVVENPAVFSVLIKKYPKATVICGNGQLRLATLALMDLFDSETTFYYAGDFDPEGLQIAQRLKERYGERLHLWNYESKLYLKYLSDVSLDSKRLKKLEVVTLEQLVDIKVSMLREKKATYQEAMIEEYIIEE